MPTLDQFKAKYASVLDYIKTHNVRLDNLQDPSLPAPVRTYTVVAGDSLWKIAQKHYGNGAQYPKIISANPGKLKDEKSIIHPGDVLVAPE